ncbi:hypothetical protein ABS71_12980 [bacterium SCN 62-11]|nr:hypothetical protein [Candidatus Eremiobacteraeota bacterium]ODT64636.1 MAG: hypothetical protein ABS71_12980 [bacterium SCN 62-11]
MKKTLLALALGLLTQGGGAWAKPQHPRWPPKDYAICYGEWTPEMVQRSHQYDLVVVHPGDDFANLNADLVGQIKRGKDGKAGTADDVIVLGYVTIGEDDHVPAGPPRPGAGPTAYINKTWKQEKASYPTRYLDQVSYVFEKNGERKYGENGKPVIVAGQDGVPDENGVWGSYYVDPGDPQWQATVLGKMGRLQKEMGVDGFFLDTIDTASPWGNYSFTQSRMAGLMKAIRKAYPERLILANRGMFLLETDYQAYVDSMDGLLYESLYCIWDWGAKRGVVSPWAVGDVGYLKDPVLPASKKAGFHMFYINYLDSKQDDFYPLMHSIEDLVGRKGISNYVSDPLLQGLGQPISELFPEEGAAPPELGNLSVSELPNGRFRLNYEVKGLDGRQLGKDLFLDVRVGKEKRDIALQDPVKVDYSKSAVEGVGLEKGTAYTVYARVVGKSRNCRTPYLEVSFTTAAGPGPEQVTELAAVSLESSVKLNWKDEGSHTYRIYKGVAPDQLAPVGTTQGRTYTVSGLQNNQPLYFAVSALEGSNEGNLCRPVLSRAEDCTPPSSPREVIINARAGVFHVSWQAVAGAKTYKVYCVGKGEKYRIPVRTEETQVELPRLGAGKFQLWVTAVDEAGNESRRNQLIDAEIK